MVYILESPYSWVVPIENRLRITVRLRTIEEDSSNNAQGTRLSKRLGRSTLLFSKECRTGSVK